MSATAVFIFELSRENAALRKALEEIAKETEADYLGDDWFTRAAMIAQAALLAHPEVQQ